MTTDNWNLLFNMVTLLLSGGALGVILNYRHKMREVDVAAKGVDREAERVDFDTILSEMRKQRDEAWERVKSLEKRTEQLEVEITGLRVARDLDPFPNWIVGAADFSYLFVNREFERLFLQPIGQSYRDIIGKRHEDMWPEAFCRTLYSLNELAKSRPDGTARATTALDVPRLGKTRVTVHKFPVKAQPSGAIIGWAGYITELDTSDRTVG